MNPRVEAYIAELEDDLLTQMCSGSLRQWTASWVAQGFPANALKESTYQFWNAARLTRTLLTKGYDSNIWATILQWNKLGTQISRGENASYILRPIMRQSEMPPETDIRALPGSAWSNLREEDQTPNLTYFAGYALYKVFNINQVTEPFFALRQKMGAIEPKQQTNLISFVRQMNCSLAPQTPNVNPAYNPNLDTIHMPPKAIFKTEEDYWCTFLHELGHWTGHPDRLNRMKLPFSADGNSVEYAFEEMIAEIASAIMGASFGFVRDLQHKEYLGGFWKRLALDSRKLWQAGQKASKVVEYLYKMAGKYAPKSLHF